MQANYETLKKKPLSIQKCCKSYKAIEVSNNRNQVFRGHKKTNLCYSILRLYQKDAQSAYMKQMDPQPLYLKVEKGSSKNIGGSKSSE